ncbi:tetratricopeptide repeat protein, partial [Cyanobium sp. Aljojuca 7A6]|uniref:tetratricopeptide repeat protein n=1 Tax=Cyanobium sp. Aljojuca 7A6 TaxID=2823697 RepID=UPI0020CD3B62
MALRTKGNCRNSVQELERLVSAFPSDITVRHELALSLRAAGDVVASLAMLEAIVAESPEHRPSVVARIDTLLQDKRPLEALQAAEVALARRSGDRALRIKHAVTLRQAQRPSESIAALEVLRAADPSDITVRHELALSLRAAGDVVASLAMLEAIVAESPEHRPSVVARIDTL